MKVEGSKLVCVRCGNTDTPERDVQQPFTLRNCFPFKSIRPPQEDVLKELENALSSKKFIILEAPVGFGKSAVAVALCKYVGSAHILTATKQLQDQYSSDFGFPIVKGKGNFQCYVRPPSGVLLPCSKGRCEVDWALKDCPHYMSFEEYEQHAKRLCDRDAKCEHLKDKKLCTYYDQKWYGFRSPISVYNYSFLLSELKYARDVPSRKLLVCDEGHELEKQIVGFAAFQLKKSILQIYHDELRPEENFVIPHKGLDDPAAWLDVLAKVGDLLSEYLDLHKEVDKMQDSVATCKNLLDALESFMGNLKANSTNWVVNDVKMNSDLSVEEVTFQPLKVSNYTSQLFKIADKVLLMSATIFSEERLYRSLGISPSEAVIIKVQDSTFPVDRRPIYALNTAYLNKASMNSSLESIAQAVNRIMDRHDTERGVIHTTSYAQARYIVDHVSERNRRRLITTEGSFDKSTLIRMHGASDSSVLISPSLHQGVDLKDDLSRFQVIVKVPYPDLSERRTEMMLKRDRSWYDWQTAQRLVQTYGRSVRSETDYAVTYVLDSNFTRFVNSNRNLFPNYFLEALKVGNLPELEHP
jgi:ATP-dependent DNA helicase DinG